MINFYVGELKFYVYLGKGGNREIIDIFLRNVSFWGIMYVILNIMFFLFLEFIIEENMREFI